MKGVIKYSYHLLIGEGMAVTLTILLLPCTDNVALRALNIDTVET